MLPEFFARIKHVLDYKPLDAAAATDIAEKFIKAFTASLDANQGITLTVDTALRDRMVQVGFHADDGARSLRPVIETSLEDALSTAYVDETVKDGATVRAVAVAKKADHGKTGQAADGTIVLGVYVADPEHK